MKITVKVQTSSKMNMCCVNEGIFYIGDASLHVTLVIRFIVCFIFYICFIVLFVYLNFAHPVSCSETGSSSGMLFFTNPQ